ncbi:PTS mannose transporter subunit IIABC [Bifidobacterium lemurum]|uniref:PTS mannose transporter subunit IIABC n=1 Tax=Bifidobacterium lemurum TaxID=1603886 RepID=A0A261FVD6_9BIFI|nr:glucose PTS transporter subunit IIA [Bifidobacterium lemurum]OZG63147.1 PTS mannose transporter subunit IIABC [Bifidobacterium lemurum]QOL33475.1 PTS glucose transporter subunit IIA [Bifidobacterium lemurum]
MSANGEVAAAIVAAVGGGANVRGLSHCAMRLRFELNDGGKVDLAGLEAIESVLVALPQSGDRCQVVVGGGVEALYEACLALPDMRGVRAHDAADAIADATHAARRGKTEAGVGGSSPESKSATRVNIAWLDAFFDYLADSFRPILGVLLAASIIIATVNLLISLGLVADDEASAGLMFVKALWEGVFYFMPIMVAYNAARKLAVDPWVGGAIMAALMTPQFASLADSSRWGDAVACVDNAALGTASCSVSVFGLPMQLNDYSGNVCVPLMMAAVLGLVYRGLRRVVPPSMRLVFVPFLSLIVVGSLTAFVIGPLGVWVGNGLGVAFAWLNGHAPFVFALLVPLMYPFLVPLGLHWPVNALILLNIQSLGYDFIQGPMGVWNFACFGATAGVLVLALREHDTQMRQTCVSALAAGLLGGVSEPSLYGIHLRYRRIYPRMLAGCAVGGLTIAVLGWLFPSAVSGGSVPGVTTTAFAFTSLLTIPAFQRMWVYGVSIAVAFVLPMVLIVMLDYREPETGGSRDVDGERATPSRDGSPTALASIFHPHGGAEVPGDAGVLDDAESSGDAAAAGPQPTESVLAPVSGHVIALDDAGDKVFASRALGEGVGVEPAESRVVAPVDGVLTTVAATGHVFGIKTDDGVEVLVHVGLDTVRMGGEGFAVAVAKKQRVHAGDLLVTVDENRIRAAGHAATVMMTVINTAKFAAVVPRVGIDVRAGDPVIDVRR